MKRKYIVALEDENLVSGYMEISCTQKHFQRLVNEYKATDSKELWDWNGLKLYLKGKVELKPLAVVKG